MKTLSNILYMFCAAVCISCTTVSKTVCSADDYKTEKRDIGQINAITTVSSIDVVYHQTKGASYAEINASEDVMPYVVLDVSGKELKVYYKKDFKTDDGKMCRIDVYTPSVTSFKTSASGDISIPKGLKADRGVKFYTYASGDIECTSVECDEFKAEASASGDIDVLQVFGRNIQVKTNASGDISIMEAACKDASLTVNASGDCTVSRMQCRNVMEATLNGSGDISVSGSCRKAVLCNNASGELDADDLKADDVSAELNGAGDLSCNVSHSLVARSYGSGSLTYEGNPSQTNMDGKRIYRR